MNLTAQELSQATPATLLALMVVALAWVLIKQPLVPMSRVRELQAQVAQMRQDYLAMEAAKDAALQRKDEQIAALSQDKTDLINGIMQQALPAIVRAGVVLDKYHTETTVRRAE